MPYAKKKLIAYLVLVSIIYGVHRGLVYLYDNRWFNLGTATLLLFLFTWFVIRIEKKELMKIPFLARVLKLS